MKAIAISRAGGPDVLDLIETPDPVPGGNEVTIDVAYAGVGLVDTLFRRGTLPMPLPLVPGIEVSGRIRALGDGVAGLRVGQRVAALLNDFVNLPGNGGYAEIARARAALTVPVPDGCDLAGAATVLVNGTTAWMALRDVARVRSGETLAVLGATGGLGGMIGRIARRALAGVKILGIVGSPSKREAAKSLGYDEVCTVDELGGRLERFGPLDAAFDTVGGAARRMAFEHLAPLGRLAVLGNASGADECLSADDAWLGTKTVSGLSVGGIAHLVPDQIASAADQVLAWVASGTLDATPARVLPLRGGADAHALLESRQIAGKLVLQVSA